MREVTPTPVITWGEKGRMSFDSSNDLEGIFTVQAFIRRLSDHGSRYSQENRNKFFSTIHVSYGGKEYSIGEDLAAFYRDENISGNKRAHEEVKRFFAVNFPDFPLTNRTPGPRRGDEA